MNMIKEYALSGKKFEIRLSEKNFFAYPLFYETIISIRLVFVTIIKTNIFVNLKAELNVRGRLPEQITILQASEWKRESVSEATQPGVFNTFII